MSTFLLTIGIGLSKSTIFSYKTGGSNTLAMVSYLEVQPLSYQYFPEQTNADRN
ncbi:hypothetical protein EG68_01948 [Paragonimus skrjabini miyazakii]|uniref:Uncharacterized protein n=1 Tax=Paragonimus skrjabini miyazakii TaxID=59628 RepID=A0A8S9Z531_9TREM|nr:hypothetical protein EG68_01948 [Paragonimus skrjabini miyazakii]